MSVATPLALRWERAQQIDRSAIEDIGQGWYIVPSSRDPTGYAVHLEFDAVGKLTDASCTCPDFEKRTEGMGTPSLHGLRVCKHVLAASLKVKDSRAQTPISGPRAQVQTKQRRPGEEESAAKPASDHSDALPAADEPAWDEECQEWVLTAPDGVHHCGATPGQCIQQFDEALHYQADHARKNDHCAEECTECPALHPLARPTAPRCCSQRQLEPSRVVVAMAYRWSPSLITDR